VDLQLSVVLMLTSPPLAAKTEGPWRMAMMVIQLTCWVFMVTVCDDHNHKKNEGKEWYFFGIGVHGMKEMILGAHWPLTFTPSLLSTICQNVEEAQRSVDDHPTHTKHHGCPFAVEVFLLTGSTCLHGPVFIQ